MNRVIPGVVLAFVVLALLAFWGLHATSAVAYDLTEQVNVKTFQTKELALAIPFPLEGFALSGTWEGPGRGRIYLLTDQGPKLVADTDQLPPLIELAGAGRTFEEMCIESCKLGGARASSLLLKVEDTGVLSITQMHAKIFSQSVTGLSINSVKPVSGPSPAVALPIIWLLLAVIGAFGVRHCCSSKKVKMLLTGIHITALVGLIALTASSVFSPTGAFVSGGKVANVFALFAIGIVVMIGMYEFLGGKRLKNEPTDLEELQKCEAE